MATRGPFLGSPYVKCKGCGKATRDPRGHLQMCVKRLLFRGLKD